MLITPKVNKKRIHKLIFKNVFLTNANLQGVLIILTTSDVQLFVKLVNGFNDRNNSFLVFAEFLDPLLILFCLICLF